jgi:hypothetical protein
MGILENIKREAWIFREIYFGILEEDRFIHAYRRIYKPLNIGNKISFTTKVREIKELVVIEIMDEIEILGQASIEKRQVLLGKYGFKDGIELAAHLAKEMALNLDSMKETNDVKWVKLKVKFLEYWAKTKKEVTGLKELESTARRLGANHLAHKANLSAANLIAEKNKIRKMINEAYPGKYRPYKRIFYKKKKESFSKDYEMVKSVLETKAALYTEQGRNPLLSAYRHLLKDCGRNLIEIAKAILAADSARQSRFGALDQLAVSAQNLREETTTVVKEVRGVERI